MIQEELEPAVVTNLQVSEDDRTFEAAGSLFDLPIAPWENAQTHLLAGI